MLKKWLVDHLQNPYLKPQEKSQLALASGLTKRQVQNWFTNVRKVGHFIDVLVLENLLSIFHQDPTDSTLHIALDSPNDAEVQGQEGPKANLASHEAQD